MRPTATVVPCCCTTRAGWRSTSTRTSIIRRRLEFPTETWAAQDMRKSEVFVFAAQHAANGPERARFVDRARFFYDYSVSTLLGTESGSLTRPLVLLLSNGFRQAGPQLSVECPAGPPTLTFDEPRRAFRPQKAIAKQRLRYVCTAAAIIIAIGAVACLAIR